MYEQGIPILYILPFITAAILLMVAFIAVRNARTNSAQVKKSDWSNPLYILVAGLLVFLFSDGSLALYKIKIKIIWQRKKSRL